MTAKLVSLRPLQKHLPVQLSSADDVRHFLSKCVPSLKGVAPSEIDVRPLTGGLTNLLHHASHPDTKTEVVVRQYGEGTEAFIDRDAEEFWISAFMDTYGRCKNGLAYQFLKGFKPSSAADMRKHHLAIARSIADFHHHACQWNRLALPFVNAPNFCQATLLRKFVDVAYSEAVQSKLKKDDDRVKKLNDTIDKAAARLRKSIERLHPVLVSGPCHNDINAPNTMIRAEGSSVEIRFIDFEYMQNNYLLYDLANHMNEYAGFDGSWSDMLSTEEKREFLRKYFERSAELCFGSAPADLGDLNAEVAILEFLELVSHVGWAAWSVAQAAHSTIDFDFVDYATLRFVRYASTVDAAEEALRSNGLL